MTDGLGHLFKVFAAVIRRAVQRVLYVAIIQVRLGVDVIRQEILFLIHHNAALCHFLRPPMF